MLCLRHAGILQSAAMKSYEVIRNAVEDQGVKAVAAALKVSAALVYKWCEPPAEQDDPEASGAKNPLDRVRDLYLLTKDIHLIRWLCNEAGGFFVTNPVPELRKSADEAIFSETREMVRDFSELLEAVTQSTEDDGRIDAEEADKIRQKWEDLKACVEHFALSCEKGQYRP
jgi:regulatory protein CII